MARCLNILTTWALAAALALAPIAALAQPPKPAYVTGSPTTGALAKASGPQSVTTGDLSGDCATSGALTLTCTLPLSHLATQAANTVVGNGTGSSGVPTALAVPACSATASALMWTTSSGFGCHTISTGAAISGTPTSGHCASWSNATTLQDAGAACGSGGSIPGSAPTVRGYLTGQASGSTLTLSLTGGSLSGVTAGDTAVVILDSASGPVAQPAGWTQQTNISEGFWSINVYTRTISSGDVSTGSVTVNFNTFANQQAFLGIFAGACTFPAWAAYAPPNPGGEHGAYGTQLVAAGWMSQNALYMIGASVRGNASLSIFTGTTVGSALTSGGGSAVFGWWSPGANYNSHSVNVAMNGTMSGNAIMWGVLC